MDIKRRLIWATVIIVLLWLATYAIIKAPQMSTAPQISSAYSAPTIDLANITYDVADVNYVLNDGVSSIAEANSSAQDTLRLYQATYGDIRGTGEQDAAVILINETGGSGVFYYLAAVFANGSTTSAVLLGDRIETDSIAIHNRTIIVHYKDRAPNQPFSTTPSISKTATFSVVNGSLVQH